MARLPELPSLSMDALISIDQGTVMTQEIWSVTAAPAAVLVSHPEFGPSTVTGIKLTTGFAEYFVRPDDSGSMYILEDGRAPTRRSDLRLELLMPRALSTLELG